jgi:arabinogalactan oligomer/maltooligosaccharide transport system permease protein
VAHWFTDLGWRHVVGLLMLFVVLLPLVYVFSASLASSGTLTGSNQLFRSISLDNYVALLDGSTVPYVTWWLNTIWVAGLTALGATLISALAAYPFARMRFRFRRLGLISLVILQMFPAILVVVAIFTLLNWLGQSFPAIGLGTHAGLILVYLGGALGVFTYIIAGNFNAVPRELDEAARIDGAGHARIFLRIILPLSLPMLIVVATLSFLFTFGEFALASVVLVKPEIKTIAVGLTGVVSASGEMRNSNWGLFCAGAVLAAVPVLVVFFVLQRWIVSGLTSGSVK